MNHATVEVAWSEIHDGQLREQQATFRVEGPEGIGDAWLITEAEDNCECEAAEFVAILESTIIDRSFS